VRDAVIESSNANALVSFTAGTKDVTNDVPAAEQVRKSNNGSEYTAGHAQFRTNIQAPHMAVAVPQGRLTLQTGAPVMTASQTGQTTVRYVPYAGRMVPIWNGSNIQAYDMGAEISVATTDTAKNPAAIGASKVNDWFIWIDSGVMRLCHGPDWTNDTTRSAGAVLQYTNGILTNGANITNGPNTAFGTYVGTTRSNASSQIDWGFGGTGVGGVAAWFGVWNMYNRVNVQQMVIDTFSSAAVTANTVSALNASNANRVSFVTGLAEDGVDALVCYAVKSGTVAASNVGCGIGLDSTSAAAGIFMVNGVGTAAVPTMGVYAGMLQGFHFLQALQIGQGDANGNIYGNSGIGSTLQGGLRVSLRL
jgi:hypothetical protein